MKTIRFTTSKAVNREVTSIFNSTKKVSKQTNVLNVVYITATIGLFLAILIFGK